MGFWRENHWDWNLNVTHELSSRERGELELLELCIEDFQLSRDKKDSWKWSSADIPIFVANSCYNHIIATFEESSLKLDVTDTLPALWSEDRQFLQK